ncbi:protein C19orf12 homolog [Zootoca vivipara]|uniref:protein C19orf12 homolog n=1 Tax=Zootoca vivipara TaxID=8524 RepID=UPI00293BC503|nr:protein C19orf12 homolog [Zootoca vivipara]
MEETSGLRSLVKSKEQMYKPDMSSLTEQEMMQLLSRLSEVWGMKVATKQPKRVSLMAGLGAFFGGLLGGGPVGIAVGATVGGLLSKQMTAGQFKPVRQIIQEMPPEKQQQLYKIALRVIRDRDMEWPNVAQLMNLVMEDVAIQEQLVGVVMDYLANELKAEIKFDKTKP